MLAMNTTLIILNSIAAAGLLVSLGLVMLTGHRAASSESTGSGHWTAPLEPELVRVDRDESELTRAA